MNERGILMKVKRSWFSSWSANSLRGQLIMVLGVGFGVVSGIDILYFKVLPDINAVGLLAAFVVFPPLLLAAKGMDISERIPAFILTFMTSSVLGVFGGVIVWSIILDVFRDIFGILLFGVDSAALEPSLKSFSAVYTGAAAIAVCISYWSVGQMSRDFIDRVAAQQGHFPHQVNRLCGILTAMNLQALERDITEALLEYRFTSVIAPDGILDRAIEAIITRAEEEAPVEAPTLVGSGSLEGYIKIMESRDEDQTDEWFSWVISILELGKNVREVIEEWPTQVGSPVNVLSLPSK